MNGNPAAEKKGRFLAWTLRLVGVGLFAFILYRIDVSRILEHLCDVRWLPFAVATALVPLTVVIKAARWRLLMRTYDIECSLWDACLVYAIGLFMASWTPGKLGDFAKVLYIRREGQPLARPFLTVFFDKLFDVGALLVFAVAAMLFFGTVFRSALLLIATALGVVLLVIVLARRHGEFLKRTVGRMALMLTPGRYRGSLRVNASVIAADFTRIRHGRLVEMILLTLANWVTYYFMCWLLARSIDLPLSFPYVVACVSVVNIVVLIPVTVAGLGTRDATFIFFFDRHNPSLVAPQAVAFSLLNLWFWIVAALLGLTAFLIKPRPQTLGEDGKSETRSAKPETNPKHE